MKNRIIVALLASLTALNAGAQDFIVSPTHVLNSTVQLGTLMIGEIDFQNNTQGALVLKWEIIEKTVPADWDYSYCDYTTCYTSVDMNGTMTSLNSGQSGFIKVNILTDPTDIVGSAHFKFKVYNELDPAGADTVEFNFQSVASVQEKPLENLMVLPNPAPADQPIVIRNLTAGSVVEVINSLGQKVVRTKVNSDELVIDGLNSRGVYFVRVQYNSITETRKLIVR